MRSDTALGRTLGAAALAAGLWPASALVLGPPLGLANALGVHLVATLALHVATLEARPARRVAHGIAAALLGGAVLALASGLPERVIGLAVVLGLCRSRPVGSAGHGARSLALEAATLLGGLVAARAAAAPGLVGTSLAIFAFGLVQTLRGVVVASQRPGSGGDVDPFVVARARLDALLREDRRAG